MWKKGEESFLPAGENLTASMARTTTKERKEGRERLAPEPALASEGKLWQAVRNTSHQRIDALDSTKNAPFFLFQTALIHLGAKYAPCMRWDETLDRSIREERAKERDTACCIRKDRAGCVQSPKAECSKIGEGGEGGDAGVTASGPPRSNWVSRRIARWTSWRR